MNHLKSPSTVRAFVAINLSTPLLKSVSDLTTRFKSHLADPSIRWNPTHQIHLTLQFLGNVPSHVIPDLMGTLSQACTAVSPLSLTAQGLGVFPNLDRPRVLWMGVGGDSDNLLRLHQAIARICQPWIFDANQDFKPHLTLARFTESSRALSEQLGLLLEELGSHTVGTWVAQEVTLMESELTRQGAEHSVLGRWKLRGLS